MYQLVTNKKYSSYTTIWQEEQVPMSVNPFAWILSDTRKFFEMQKIIKKTKVNLVSWCLGLQATLCRLRSSTLNILITDDISREFALSFCNTCSRSSVDAMNLENKRKNRFYPLAKGSK